ncbi:MAG TPA: pirin family protein [Burkholderiaceae bacterium]|nr:pirin family protein [Burkholderiaceae bacterium]
MTSLRLAQERGHANHGWLESYHTFSFADYYDAQHMGFGPLRVINEDRVQAGSGFGTHSHRDMEIISYVLKGALAHKDSIGNASTIVPGDVQRMSAGTGVRHSEYNANPAGITHFLQIWIEPNIMGAPPGYEQKHFPAEQRRGRLRLVVSPDGRDGSLSMNQNALVFAGLIDGDENAHWKFEAGRKGYLHLALGTVTANGQLLNAGDALMMDGGAIEIERGKGAEVLLFDLPPD